MRLIVNLRKSLVFKKALYIGVIISAFLYIFFIPSFGERSSSLTYAVYASMILLGGLVIIYNLLFLDFKISGAMLVVVFFAIFSFIGTTLYSKDYRRWLSIVLLTFSFLIFVQAFRIIKDRNIVISVTALAFFFFSLYFIWHYKSDLIHFKDFVSGKFRLGDYFDNPNGVAAYSVVGFASALYYVLFGKRKVRFLFLLPAFTSGIVGVATGSRSFVFACLVFVVVYLFFVFNRHKFIYLISLVALIGLFILFLQLSFMATIKERIIQAFLTIFGAADKADTSTIERTIWFDYGMFLGFRNGLVGYGANGFSIFSGVGTYTHSNISEVLCDFGYIGFFLFYSPLIILLVKTIVDKRINKPLVISFVIYYIFIGISNVFYYKKVYYMVLALCFYVVYSENPYKKELFKDKKPEIIMFTCEMLSSGGAERVISILANQFSLNNIKIYIIGISDRGIEKPFYKLNENVTYIPMCESFNNVPFFFKRVHLLRKNINDIKPNVVISFLPHINVYTTCALLGKKDICHIVSERNNPITDPKGLIRKIAKRISFDLADGCVFQSMGAKQAYPDPIQDKSAVIMNPIDISNISLNFADGCVFQSTGAKQAYLDSVQDKSAVHRVNISDFNQSNRIANNTFINVGRLVPQKNQSLLVDAFNDFNNKHDNIYHLKIYGKGPLKEELSSKCSEFVTICEPDLNWLNNEKDARCFILSSDYEGMPNTLIEALSIGIPCISSNCDIGGPQELHDRGFKFLLFKPNDKNDLIRCMEETIQDSKTYYSDNVELANTMNSSVIANEWLNYIYSL